MQKISKKLVAVMKGCSHVAKNGINDFHHYDCATAADVLQMVNDSLTKHGISSVVSTSLIFWVYFMTDSVDLVKSKK